MNNQIAINVSGAQGMVPYTYKTVVLKPNVVDDKNLLTQEMMNAANTKYVIKYDYTLSDAIVEKSVNVISTNVSQCGNAAYAQALADYNAAHNAWIEADNAYTNDPNDTTLAAKNAAYDALQAAQLTLNGTPQYYYFAGSAITVKKGHVITVPEGCVLLNEARNGVVDFGVAYQDMVVYVGSATLGTYNYMICGGIEMPANCLIEFDGGTISNGTLVGQNTILIYNQPLNDILTATLEGTWRHESGVKADEEDITDLNGELKFKDKNYAPADYSGLGRKYLRKNLVNGVNTLTQEMISDANTIYVIQYDFTLGEDITVPANCVLEFDGGGISGAYTITSQNTGIQAGLVKIFNTNVSLDGTWKYVEAYPEWFGAVGDGATDDRLPIQKTIDYFDVIKFQRKKYIIGSYYNNDYILKAGLNIGRGVTLIGMTPTDLQSASSTIYAKRGIEFTTLVLLGSSKISIIDMRFEGDREAITINDYEDWDGTIKSRTMFSNFNTRDIIATNPDLNFINQIELKHVTAGFCKECAITLRAFETTLDTCMFSYTCVDNSDASAVSFYAPKLGGNNTSITISNCFVNSSFGHAYALSNITYSSLINAHADFCGYNIFGKTIAERKQNPKHTYFFQNCFGISLISCALEQSPRAMSINNTVAMFVCGGSFDVYMGRFFDNNYDTYNYYFSQSKYIEFHSCYLSHSLANNGLLMAFATDCKATINNCYYSYTDKKPIEINNITVNSSSYVLVDGYQCRQLNNLNNVDDITENGKYYISNANFLPASITKFGLLDVKRTIGWNADVVVQEYFTKEGIFYRYKNNDETFENKPWMDALGNTISQ